MQDSLHVTLKISKEVLAAVLALAVAINDICQFLRVEFVLKS